MNLAFGLSDIRRRELLFPIFHFALVFSSPLPNPQVFVSVLRCAFTRALHALVVSSARASIHARDRRRRFLLARDFQQQRRHRRRPRRQRLRFCRIEGGGGILGRYRSFALGRSGSILGSGRQAD